MVSHRTSTPVDSAPAPDERALQTAIVKNPASARDHAALVSFLCSAGRVDEALDHVDREIAHQPSKIWPLSIKAGIFSSERRAEEALDIHRALVAMAPDVPLLWSNFGSDLSAAGEAEEAAVAFRRAVEHAPESGSAWLGLANLPGVSLGKAEVAAMELGLTAVRDPYQEIQLLIALGRAHEALGSYAPSFARFTEANMLRETVTPYDCAPLAAFVEAHRGLPASAFGVPQGRPAQTPGAIFIVGMPRSGTTLVEQIVASHPDVEGMGELFALADVAATIGAFDSPEAYVRRLQTLGHEESMQLAERYLAGVRRHRRTDRPNFTDKMPANWRFVALILRIMPDARIIDVRRDPIACCFSAYTSYFNRRTDFPNTLPDLGRYYRRYLQMMEMAREWTSEGLHWIDHRRLVSNPEGEIRELLGFLRLPFTSSCLRPEENRRAIYTPSAQQVRAPIRQLKDRSQNYLPWLQPFRATFAAAH